MALVLKKAGSDTQIAPGKDRLRIVVSPFAPGDEPVMIWRGRWDIPRGHVVVEVDKERLCGRGGI